MISQVFTVFTYFFWNYKTSLSVPVLMQCSVHADNSVDYVIQIEKLHVQLFQLIWYSPRDSQCLS